MAVVVSVVVPHPPIIVPEVGRGEEKKIIKTDQAYQKAMQLVASYKPETIIILSPHTVMYADYFHLSPGRLATGNLGNFNANNVAVEANYDTDLVTEISRLAKKRKIPAGTLGEKDSRLDHATIIPLYYLQKFYTDFEVVRIGLSGLSFVEHYQFGQCLQQAANNLEKKVAIIASGDFSHKLLADGPYGFVEEGPEFDQQLVDILKVADFGELLKFSPVFTEAAAECGLRSFQIMAGALDQFSLKNEFLSYEGPFGVGYGVATFEVIGKDGERNYAEKYFIEMKNELKKCKEKEGEFVKLARLSLETYILTGKMMDLPADLSGELLEKQAGVFVSLKKDGLLRGCIGTIAPTKENLALEIMTNAISAAVNDPRFNSVTEDELDSLIYSVDVLGEAEPIEDLQLLDEKKYGVIVEQGIKKGLLLPNLEGINSVEEQIKIAKCKAGIQGDDHLHFFRFEVVRHK